MKMISCSKLSLLVVHTLVTVVYVAESTSRHIPHKGIQACGSRLIDELNAHCANGVTEPRNCYIASLYLCARPKSKYDRRNTVLCRLSCGYKRPKRSTEESSAATYRSDREFLRRLRRSNRNLAITSRSRIKRAYREPRIVPRCCLGRCTLGDLRSYCRIR